MRQKKVSKREKCQKSCQKVHKKCQKRKVLKMRQKIIKKLSKHFGLSTTFVQIKSGHKSHQKIIEILQ